ncbi:MAG: XdhC family protein [Actinomycetota bacterium]|nr:XdhC family protein [Actinomycetota bacterium]MDK1039530.1 XdhC family protein [Actinomycetota bacterium]MDK1104289.1 XdhC family protein [Actinomycetota bacterium]MDK1292832.1 XdhC family protein [Actinomycetota bacterium]
MVKEVLDAVGRLKNDERLGAMITVIDGPDTGSVVVVERSTGHVAGDGSPWLDRDVVEDANDLMDREESRVLFYGDRRIFIDTIAPSPVMLIFGAGHIAQPLSMFARELGFRVVVADARATWATSERFPNVDELIVAWPDAVFDHIVPRRQNVCGAAEPRQPVRDTRLSGSARRAGQVSRCNGVQAYARIACRSAQG